MASIKYNLPQATHPLAGWHMYKGVKMSSPEPTKNAPIKTEQSIHQLDRHRLYPGKPASVDPANTDPANEAMMRIRKMSRRICPEQSHW